MRYAISLRPFFFSILILLLAAAGAGTQTFIYTFETGSQGWTGDFADYPVLVNVR